MPGRSPIYLFTGGYMTADMRSAVDNGPALQPGAPGALPYVHPDFANGHHPAGSSNGHGPERAAPDDAPPEPPAALVPEPPAALVTEPPVQDAAPDPVDSPAPAPELQDATTAPAEHPAAELPPDEVSDSAVAVHEAPDSAVAVSEVPDPAVAGYEVPDSVVAVIDGPDSAVVVVEDADSAVAVVGDDVVGDDVVGDGPVPDETVAAEVADRLGAVVGEDVESDPAEFAAAAVLDVLRASGWADAAEAAELRAEAERTRELLNMVVRDHRAREASAAGTENQQLYWLVPLLRAAHGVAFGSLGAKVALRTAVQDVPPEVLLQAGLRIDYGVEPAEEDAR